MTSARFVASAREHEKCVKAGNEAAAFWMWAIQWSHQKRTDGFLDQALLHKIPPTPVHPKKAKVLAELCVSAFIKPGGAGLFDRADGGYRIHDFHDFPALNDDMGPTSELSKARSEAGRLGASKRWQTPMAKDGNQCSLLDGKEGGLPVAKSVVCHDGSRPILTLGSSDSSSLSSSSDPEGDSNRGRAKKRRSTIPDGWSLTDEDVAYATKRGWDRTRMVDEAEHFANHHKAKGTLSTNWHSSWVTWVLQGRRFERSSGVVKTSARSVQPGTELFAPEEEFK